jgi:branched-chain amino acid aminotransferase
MEGIIKAWIDGNLINCNDAKVSLLSHSFSRASAIFEVMAITPAKHGPAFFCLDEHLNRFYYSAESTYMSLALEKEELKKALIQTAQANSIQNGLAKFYAYYPDIELGTNSSNHISVAIFCLDFAHMGTSPGDMNKPVSVGISRYRKLHPQTAPVHAKVVGNYVNGFLAKKEIKQKGYEEVLMLDTNGYVAEGPTSNIFFIQGNSIYTPTKENVLPGITRRVIMEVIENMGYPKNEKHILPEDMLHYDEAFFSGTLNTVQPIKSIEDKIFKCPGALTTAIRDKMNEVLTGQLPQYEKFLTYVG